MKCEEAERKYDETVVEEKVAQNIYFSKQLKLFQEMFQKSIKAGIDDSSVYPSAVRNRTRTIFSNNFINSIK
jgi:hypothetical protein